jgi:hypothetical protein
MHEPIYMCHITGREVQPLSVGDIQTIRGVRYAWFYCRECDVNEHRRSEVGFDATLPGIHVAWFDEPQPARVWTSRFMPFFSKEKQ